MKPLLHAIRHTPSLWLLVFVPAVLAMTLYLLPPRVA